MSDSTQLITLDERDKGLIGIWQGHPGVIYTLNKPPYTNYHWDGTALVVSDGAGYLFGTAATLNFSIDGTAAANSDELIATQKAMVSYVASKVAQLVNSSPAALDTLAELAAALGSDPNFATTMTTALAGKLSSSAISAFWLTVLDDTTAAASFNTLGISSFIQTLLNDATAAEARATLGIVSTGTPSVPVDFKDSVDCATTANITLSGEQTIDGFTTSGSRVLVMNQTLGQNNGFYLSGGGAWSRTTDADTSAEVTSGVLVYCSNGTLNANLLFQLITPDPITLGTTPLTFASTAPPPGVFIGKTVAGTTYSTVLNDASKRLNLTNAATKAITITKQSTTNFPVNTEIEVYNAGAGLATLVADTGVTLTGTLTVAQFTVSKVKKRANPNSWDVTGSSAGGGAGLTNFTEAVSIASPNATNPAVSLVPNNAATNVDAVFGPKAGGDLLAQVPDGTTAGGNKRGGYSTDWQRVRHAANQVASGFASTISGGYDGKASANYATVIGGYGGVASGSGSIAGGGENGTGFPTASGQCAIALGLSATAAGIQGIALGSGTASGNYSLAIGMGGTYAAAGSGSFNIFAPGATLDGNGSFALGGGSCYAHGIANSQQQAIPGPINGFAQWRHLVLAVSSTTATPTALTTDSSLTASAANQCYVANGWTILVTGKVLAYDTTYSGGPIGGNVKAWTFSAVIQRRGVVGTTVVLGGGKDIIAASAGAAAWDLTIQANTTTGVLEILGTGAASKTLRWTAEVDNVMGWDNNT